MIASRNMTLKGTKNILDTLVFKLDQAEISVFDGFRNDMQLNYYYPTSLLG